MRGLPGFVDGMKGRDERGWANGDSDWRNAAQTRTTGGRAVRYEERGARRKQRVYDISTHPVLTSELLALT